MNTNPEREFTFMDWLETDQSNDFTEYHNESSGPAEEGWIFLKASGKLKEEEEKRILKAKNQTFELAIKIIFDALVANFEDDYRKTDQKIKLLELEKKETQIRLESDSVNFRNALTNKKDLNVISGIEYEIFNELSGWGKSRLIYELKYRTVFRDPMLLAFARFRYLKWLEDFNKINVLTLESFFVDNNSFSNLINELTTLKIRVDDEAPALVKEGLKTTWNKDIPATLKYLSAFIFMLKQGGWIFLKDTNGKKLSERNLVQIIKNTFNIDIGRVNAGPIIKNEGFKQNYYAPFFDILRRDNQENFQLLKSKLS